MTDAPTLDEAIPEDRTRSSGIASSYTAWQNNRTPENLAKVVAHMHPTIDYKVGTMGGADNPKMRHQGRLLAAEAIRKYDPASGTALRTWVQTNLQGLNRYRRENSGPLKVPERAVLDAWTLEKHTRNFLDEHGREPDTRELADLSGMSIKRMTAVRQATRAVASDAQMVTEPTVHGVDFMGEAMEYLYDDLDYIDRRIVDHTVGYGGSEQLPKNVIAQRLGVSPSQVTRRSDAIARRLQELESDLQTAYQ